MLNVFIYSLCLITILTVLFSAVPYGVKRDLWADIPGDFVANLTSSPKYVNNSDMSISDILNRFDASFDAGDNFGQRLTTFFMVNAKICFEMSYWLGK